MHISVVTGTNTHKVNEYIRMIRDLNRTVRVHGPLYAGQVLGQAKNAIKDAMRFEYCIIHAEISTTLNDTVTLLKSEAGQYAVTVGLVFIEDI